MSVEPESPQITSATDEKARLECEKLKAEINAINKPLVRTPAFYSAIAPVALAILGLAFSWWSGWFDVQRTRIINEKTLLEAQTERLKMEQTTLEAKAQEQQAAFVKAEGEIQALKEREFFLTNQLVRLERERTELRSAKDLLENETKRLAGSDAKATQFFEQLKSLQATREQLSTDLEVLQASNVTLRATVTQQGKYNQRASDLLSEGLNVALTDRSSMNSKHC
jgi:DNA repair exonuclease SbcCD ATPase subunit